MTNNRIDTAFKNLRENNETALVTFITMGDPDIDTSKKLVIEMEKSGASLIELGIPFSDPMAEGPVIQEANVRALDNKDGITLDKIFDAVKELRCETQIPLVYLMYYNSLLTYGREKFFERCTECGIDGVIIPDLPFEESGEIYDYTEKYGVYQISLVSPTSSEERMKKICDRAKGFLYCVSSMGVTGVRDGFNTDFDNMFAKLNSFSDMPKCIGFGISKPEHVAALKHYCDGVIVGSAIVKQVAAGSTPSEKINNVKQKVQELKEAAAE